MRAVLPHRLRGLPRSSDFGALQETLVMTGVATVLVIRTQLWLTHYPQLGGHGLHIAHLLWGGLFMLVAIGLLLTFVGPGIRLPAAVLGGIGFGFFIDELGKFVTADNNYFYRPAAALIYLVFIALFLISRALQRRRGLSPAEDLANAIDLLGAGVRSGLDGVTRRRALTMLDQAEHDEPLAVRVRALVDALPVRPPARPGMLARALAAARILANRLSASQGFPRLVAWMLGAWALLSTATVFELVLSIGVDLGGGHRGYVSDRIGDLGFVNLASLGSSVVSAALVAHGVRRLRRGDRAGAWRSFDRALLIAIFVTQVFSFVESQFGAVFGLAVDLVLLAALRSVAAPALDRPEGEEHRPLTPPLAERPPARPATAGPAAAPRAS
jgi:hypothetical protein